MIRNVPTAWRWGLGTIIVLGVLIAGWDRLAPSMAATPSTAAIADEDESEDGWFWWWDGDNGDGDDDGDENNE